MQSNKRDIEISKAMSWILRHGALKEGLEIGSDGFLELSILLSHKSLKNKNCSEADIQRIIQNDQKQRFTLKTNSKGLSKIRANQGHSMKEVCKLQLKKVSDPKEIALVVHGTYYKFWESIKSEGLRRMQRNHIHFSNSDKIKPGEIHSGFRSNCEILIYIDVLKSMKDGIEFYISENNVILSSGLNGVILPKYFSKVLDRKSKNLMINK